MGNVHIEQRDIATYHAHIAVSQALSHLDKATIHAKAIGDDVHVEHLAGIMRQLSEAREPLAEHIDFVEANANPRWLCDEHAQRVSFGRQPRMVKTSSYFAMLAGTNIGWVIGTLLYHWLG